jgi:hypothetical protein
MVPHRATGVSRNGCKRRISSNRVVAVTAVRTTGDGDAARSLVVTPVAGHRMRDGWVLP